MTTIPAPEFTVEGILADLHDRLGYARAELKQATLRGFERESSRSRVLTLAGLIATYDSAVTDPAEFIPAMLDVSEIAEYYTPEGK